MASDDGTDPHENKVVPVPTPQELREQLVEMLRLDLRGPRGGKAEEILGGNVRDRYLLGVLAPQGVEVRAEQRDDEAAGDGDDEDGAVESKGTAVSAWLPSSFGMTCAVDAAAKDIVLTAAWGHYQRVRGEDDEEIAGKGEKAPLVWRRRDVRVESDPVPLAEGVIGPWTPDATQPEVTVRGSARRAGESWLVTLFLVNGQRAPEKLKDAAFLFQAELSVAAADCAPIFVQRGLEGSRGSELDPVAGAEEAALAMVYRRQLEFAVGHGIGVHAETAKGDPTRGVRVTTASIPEYEVPATDSATPRDWPTLEGLELDMMVLAGLGGTALASALLPLASAYEAWIGDGRRGIDDPAGGLAPHRAAANAALDRCARALERIREGLRLLASDPLAAEAFRFANRAMGTQRIRTAYAEARSSDPQATPESFDKPEVHQWRPFQLAFLLLNLPSTTDPLHPDRSGDGGIADLLWFPTGGGKTEAYLGLAAYVMALRRLWPDLGGLSGHAGVAVLMRYTLRLLTIQQFQRAASLVAACEVLRRQSKRVGEARFGREPFRLGLWVGSKNTPNTTEASFDAANALRSGRSPDGGSPVQITSCPWCGNPIDPRNDLRVERAPSGPWRSFLFCPDRLGECPFSERQSPDEGIPVVVVDEEIYRRLPTFLIATVDKFAQLPWNGETQMLFGRVEKHCPRHGFLSPESDDASFHPAAGSRPAVRAEPCSRLRPPELIIQDELHLISGPLGSLVGLYETAIDWMCEWKLDGRTVRPKVVASTATIRRAAHQVHSLYSRKVEVFPPPGTSIEDNFFSLRRSLDSLPGRRYLGICAPGRRMKQVQIRVNVALLAGAQSLFRRHGRLADPWMTLVGYFNSLRELGSQRRLVDDDIRNRIERGDEIGLARRPWPKVEELTSRRDATEIPKLLSLLNVGFEPDPGPSKGRPAPKDRRPIDVLLATNMISVGVDVPRLGLMVVAGQPKNTAEYIQATSRVGRRAPGLIVTIFNWARPRDLSHLERFEHYHATFYRHVEALSVTPFAPRALDRGLAALLVALVRLPSFDFTKNDDASKVAKVLSLVQEAVATIRDRAAHVTTESAVADDVEAALRAKLDVWEARAAAMTAGVRLGYQSGKGEELVGLLARAGTGPWEHFTCLNSLRDVESTVGLVFSEDDLDDRRAAGATP